MLTAPAAGAEPLILIAGANDDARREYCDAFRGAAWVCDEAVDGREALVKTLTRHPAALVTTISLPFIDGFSLTRVLRSDAETRLIPIVLLAAEPVSLEQRRAAAVGADAIIVRPMPSLVVERTTDLIARSRELRIRADLARSRMAEQLQRSTDLLERSARHHAQLVRSHRRYHTTTPPLPPPAARCPECDALLTYTGSHIGGVSRLHAEQWDYFQCAEHGEFQYRQRTRKLRRV